jgi:hypothetical protein
MNCKLCGTDAKLVKAHIVPEAFFRAMMGEPGEGALLISNNKSVHPRRSPIGVYDRELVCGPCEVGFGNYDDYGQQVLLTETFARTPVHHGKRALGSLLDGVEYRRFKLFALSVLWRAEVSSHPYYRHIQLGPHFQKLQDMVRRGDPGEPNDFAVCLCEYISPYGPILWSPFLTRIDGIRFCSIPMGKYAVLVKVDKRGIEDWELHLQPGKPLGIAYQQFRGSEFERGLKDALRAHSRPRKS